MNITLYPIISDAALIVEKRGDALVVNGETFDFSQLPNGATLPNGAVDSPYIFGEIERIDGVLHIALRPPVSMDSSESARFPGPLINPPDGPLELPQ